MFYFYNTSITSVTMIVLDCKILIIMYSISGTVSIIRFVYMYIFYIICALNRIKTLKLFDYRGTSSSNQQYFVMVCNCCIFEHQHFSICMY